MLPKLEGFAAARPGPPRRGLARDGVLGDLERLRRDHPQSRDDLSAVLTDTSIAARRARPDRPRPARGQSAPEALAHRGLRGDLGAGPRSARTPLSELAYAARALRDNGEFPLPGLGTARRPTARVGVCRRPASMTSTPRTSRRSKTISFAGRAPSKATTGFAICSSTATPPSKSRLGLTDQLLEGKVDPVTLALARFTDRGRSSPRRRRDPRLPRELRRPVARLARRARAHRARPLLRHPARPGRLTARAHRQRASNSRSPTTPPCSVASSSRSATCASTPPPRAASAPCTTRWPRPAATSNPLSNRNN